MNNQKPVIRSLVISALLSVVAPLAVFPLVSAPAIEPVAYILLMALFLIVTLLATFLTGGWGDALAVRQAPRSSLGVQSSADIGNHETGTVKWFDASKGYGFILRDSGPEIFVHYRSILGEGHRVLYEGQRVTFVIARGRKGLQAEDVALIAA